MLQYLSTYSASDAFNVITQHNLNDLAFYAYLILTALAVQQLKERGEWNYSSNQTVTLPVLCMLLYLVQCCHVLQNYVPGIKVRCIQHITCCTLVNKIYLDSFD